MVRAIIDSGSTKADWRITEGNEVIAFQTEGYNPYFTDVAGITKSIRQKAIPHLGNRILNEIFFYGAGCAAQEKKEMVSSILNACFPGAHSFVETDLFGAARGLLGRKPGIIAILGTGANSGLYDGNHIIRTVDSAGYLLGDEGSGAHLGKLILRSWLRKTLSPSLLQSFSKFCPLGRDEILNRLYHDPHPNRFLAGFAYFAAENIDTEEIRTIVRMNFEDFVEQIISRYENFINQSIFITGSIASNFRNILEEVGLKSGLRIASIVQSPIEGLVKYHSQPVLNF